MGKFKTFFRKYDIRKTGASLSIDLPFSSMLGEKLDRAQMALDAQVWEDIQRYMPIDTGLLISETNALNVVGSGEVYLYPPQSDYGHYQYEGIKYVDPKYGIGAFYSPSYGFWSRAGIEKIPSDVPLFYSNPQAEAHWDEVAYQNHHKEWTNVVKRALK